MSTEPFTRTLSAKAEAVLRAAAAFGDARVGHEALVRIWERGASRDEMLASSERAIAAGHELERAARAYATSIRKRATNPPVEPVEGQAVSR